MSKKHTMHVISHTHWDREWYLSFQRFRMRLVDLFDRLLDLMDRDPNYLYFNMDGQTIVLEDYLQIRPEKEAILRKRIEEGRILVGPWYQLNDEFLVSGESSIRSLLVGHRVASSYGPVMKVGYLPDNFGNISQMPQIFNGFGINNCIFGRGWVLQGDRKMEMIWEAPDGSRVTSSLMAFWYNNAQRFPADPEDALNYTRGIRDRMAPVSAASNLLLMNGVDHLEAQYDLSPILAAIAPKLEEEGVTIVHSTLPAYIEAMMAEKLDLPVYRGELREDRGSNVLAGTLSSRIYIKLANERTQNWLEKYAEPTASLAWILGKEYPSGYMNYCWKLLMQNHPHDSICGCSIDQVHKEMMPRFEQVQQVAGELTERSCAYLADKIMTRSDALVAFNTLGYDRSEVIETQLDLPLGPKRRDPAAPAIDIRDNGDFHQISLVNPDGEAVPMQLLSTEIVSKQVISPVELPMVQNYRRFKLLTTAEAPALGYRAYSIEKTAPRPAVGPNISPERNVLENGIVRVEIGGNGSLTICNLTSGRYHVGCNLFEDGGDAGDEYLYRAPVRDRVVSSMSANAEVSLLLNGPLLARYQVDLKLTVPESATGDGRDRTERTVEIPIRSIVTLKAGSPAVEIETTVENGAKDHRLRALFPCGVDSDVSFAEGQFDVVERPLVNPLKDQGAVPYNPQQGWVDMHDADGGLAVINQGLPEYEVYGDRRKTIAITLLRAVGQLSGGSDAPGAEKTPEAQCLGTYTFRYAAMPHAGSWEQAKLWRIAQRFNTPLLLQQTEAHDSGQLPMAKSFIELTGEGLVVSALKHAEDRDSLILRFYNITDHSVRDAGVRIPGARKAYRVNLNEEREAPLEIASGAVRMEVGAKKIVTLEFEF